MPRVYTWAQYTEKLANVPRTVRQELEKAARVAAERHTEVSQDILEQQIYSIPEKVRPYSGEKLWERTNELRNEDKFVAKGMDIVHENSARHAMRRYHYGTPKGAKGQTTAQAPQQVSHWFRDAILRLGPWLHRLRAEAIAEGWRRAG